MKTISIILGLAFVIIAFVMVSLARKGGALKPAGVIKPAEITDLNLIAQQIAVRLFPDFQEAKAVIWRVEGDREELAGIARTAFTHYRSTTPHTLQDLRQGAPADCPQNCWFIIPDKAPPPPPLPQSEDDVEIVVQYFDRDEKVSEACDAEKILDTECMRPVSVREVRRKFRSAAPHYFMRRYQKSQFYLYLERPKAS